MSKYCLLASTLMIALCVGSTAHGQENTDPMTTAQNQTQNQTQNQAETQTQDQTQTQNQAAQQPTENAKQEPTASKPVAPAPIPTSFDLRTDDCITSVKRQSGGTCWAHGAIASIESNMIKTGVWKDSGQTGVPNLSEYHLDWWNGFNMFHNSDQADVEDKVGMKVHQGGDYRVTAAYISRGDGVIFCPDSNDTKGDRLWYKYTPDQNSSDYSKYFVRDIEWFIAGTGLENINKIKRRIMEQGAVATCYCAGKRYNTKDHVHYQPASTKSKPNHAVVIVGWDDNKITTDDKNRAPLPGAWLIKNSWGTKAGEEGYMWISYFDKHCCQHEELGAVSFRNIEPIKYNVFYYHDYHGWRGVIPEIKRAFNSYKATSHHEVQAVNFVTCNDNVNYVVKIFDRFEDGLLLDELASIRGKADVMGVHTVDLPESIKFKKDEDFFVYLEVSQGGQAIDRTSEIPVLLGNPGPSGPTVISKANPGESFYHDGKSWLDLYDYKFENPEWATFDKTANFCIKALGVKLPEPKDEKKAE